MTGRKAKAPNRIFTFKVIQSNDMGNVRGRPYRVLAVPENSTLYQFADVILASFEFDMDHAFGFYDNLTRWSQSTEGYELFSDDDRDPLSEFPGVKKTPVRTVFTEIGKKMLFLFDYGDEWHFRVDLVGIEPAGTPKSCAVCVKSVGKARPQYDEPDEDDSDDDE
jgi:hypothetical protein